MPHDYSNPKSKLKYSGTRKRLRLLMIVLVCFMAWAGMTFWEQVGKVNAKVSSLNQSEAKLAVVQKQNEEYKIDILRLNDKEYIEQRVRKEFQMKRPGEKIYITPNAEND